MVTNITNLFVFWNGKGQIIPHLLYEYFASKGIGNYFSDEINKKTSEPVIVKIVGNIVSPVNVGYLLDITKNYILECTQESGEAGPILDSLHKSTALFGDKNLKLLPTLNLEFLTDRADCGYFPFKNGVIKVTSDDVLLLKYDEIDQYIWGKNIIKLDYIPFDLSTPGETCDFLQFLKDITVVEDALKSVERFNALSSAIGYLAHRKKDAATTKAIILLDVYSDGLPGGGSGKTLLINAIGKIRNLSIIDGKRYDSREWFGLSSVELETQVLLFDDVPKEFDFELIFPLMSTGMFVRRKYKDHVFVPFEKAPKVAITTNYAINGTSSSFLRRMYEFEVSGTYSSDYSPRDKFGRNMFDEWDNEEWNRFYNVIIQCLQVFLKNGLIDSEPINLGLSKLINKSSSEFVEWADLKLAPATLYDKKRLYDGFVKAYPELSGKVKQSNFTRWLRNWAEYKKLVTTESHSGDSRFIQFSTEPIV
jgi:hypothetical protein